MVKDKSIETSDFIDAGKWEEVKRGGDEAIRWIGNQLNGTSVMVVLIGAKHRKENGSNMKSMKV